MKKIGTWLLIACMMITWIGGNPKPPFVKTVSAEILASNQESQETQENQNSQNKEETQENQSNQNSQNTEKKQENQSNQASQKIENNQKGQEKESAKKQQEKKTAAETTSAVGNDTIDLTAVSAILIEGSTGEILYAKEENTEMPPASITKIMTLLLIFEAIENGQITLSDEVTVSEHAAGKGGSQVYLEPGETQTVETMIKCISIASANDAATAMAEYVGGSEEAFAVKMNEKAKQLGMEHTNFVNCTGLDAEGHYSSAKDVALMSRELITRYPEISRYSTTWMDTIIHKTRRGESEFGLTNTNKLVRTYDGITGLKTGSTDKAKFCLSATARRNECDMIAVVMGCPSPKDRFEEAAKLLNYGFANCKLFTHTLDLDEILEIPVKRGIQENITAAQPEAFRHLFFNGESPDEVTWEIQYPDYVEAPIAVGDPIAVLIYRLGDTEIGRIPICAAEEVQQADYFFYFKKLVQKWLVVNPE